MQRTWILGITVLGVACGGSGANGTGDDGGGSLVTSFTGSATNGDTEGGGETEASGNSATDSNSGGPGSSPTQGSGGSDGAPKFDIGGVPDSGASCGGGNGSGLGTDFSYIWVANSPEGTVSKINTQTLVEEGRYLVRADTGGSPSRTSVNLNGDMAVANRFGGVTMIRARIEDCPDPANTSTGSADVKAWQDGCIAWHTPFNYSRQRPMAWTQGDFSNATCRYENVKLWTSGAINSGSIMDVVLMDGETGVVEQTVPVGVASDNYGIYGGAVDADGNFWGSMLSGQTLFRVNRGDFAVSTWPAPSGYGMTVDPVGRPWTCQSQLARFNPVTELWDSVSVGSQGGGCMVDANDILWVAGTGNRLLGVDIDTMALVQEYPIPGYAKGISIDFEGNVWAVSQGAEAWRVDPATGAYDTFTGLTSPYTYSDMTGFALSQSGSPQG